MLDDNVFDFNGKHYIQKDGTAIGSRLGRYYACTFMGWWEQQLLETSQHKPFIFYRYVDDIVGIWQYGEESFKKFVELANKVHPKIKVVSECSKVAINFLDVKVSFENKKIKTEIYTKETDQHMYVHRKSQHPATTKKAIPYGLAIHAKKI